jgi:light-regulated signal transduction histidine kinase (bacteriophytochrome)
MLTDPMDPQAAHEDDDAVEQEFNDFAYIVSHDLAASFRHVSEFSRLLLGDLGPDLSVRQQRYAQRIQATTDECQAMMEQLLAYSRVLHKPLALAPVDATHLMRLAAMQQGAAIRQAGAEVVIESLGEVHADPDLLAQTFSRLLDNAVKFARPGVAPRVGVSAAHTHERWTLRVRDNGVGLEPQFWEKAFRMFQRLHARDVYPGVGAGLPICRRIARRHGGDVCFVDQPQGACIELTLPSGRAVH